MCAMAAAAEAQSGDTDWAAVIRSMKASMPPCHSYLQPLATFVKNYAGGPGAPIYKYPEGFA
jgi:hypothetical protein